LLEAIYLLSIAKSSRVSNDKFLINNKIFQSGGHSQILGIAEEKNHNIKAQVDYDISTNKDLDKTYRINGVIVSMQEFVGNINSVFFDTDDISIITGSPLIRRKYLNILLSQINNDHVKNLQRFQKVPQQRNSLLKKIKDGKSNENEIEFWDDRLAEESSSIFFERNNILNKIKENSKIFALDFNDQIKLDIKYVPKIGRSVDSNFFNDNPSLKDVKEKFKDSLKRNLFRDIDQRTTILGPHRDDFEIIFNGSPAFITASRGQARIIALSLKLSEAKEIKELVNRNPILILDDIFSELDQVMREKVLEQIINFDQILLSTADLNLIDKKNIKDSNYFSITEGKVVQS